MESSLYPIDRECEVPIVMNVLKAVYAVKTELLLSCKIVAKIARVDADLDNVYTIDRLQSMPSWLIF